MEHLNERRHWNMRTWLLARSAELREDVRGARRDFNSCDHRRKFAEAAARGELAYIDRALEQMDAGSFVFEES
jgi:hypothetical protein